MSGVIGWGRKTRGRVYHAFEARSYPSKWLLSLCGRYMLRADVTDAELPVTRQRCRECLRQWLARQNAARGKRVY